MTLIGLRLVQFFIAIIGIILCCIGYIPAMVLVFFSDIVAYLILTRYFERMREEASDATETVLTFYSKLKDERVVREKYWS